VHTVSAFAQDSLLSYGRSWLRLLLGADYAGAVFLVGGVFKTLIHGRPPRDVDLWAPGEVMRGGLVETLLRRGAIRVRDNPPFQEVFSLAGHRIEVSYDTRHRSLESLLGHVDLALSAVGYEHLQGVERCYHHPLAMQSVLQRRILLLKPLVNWKYALYTLERMHRYGEELGFEVPPEEEAFVWATFAAQPPDVRQGMIDRYRRVSETRPEILQRAQALCASRD
jgi:hypothetical protein